MNELETLTKIISDNLPRLMELSEGQELKSLKEDLYNDIFIGSVFTIGDDCEITVDGEIEISGYVYEIGEDFEIVGKKPMLNDVLEFFRKTNTFTDRGWGEVSKEEKLLDMWDLSKPFLKDQSLDLIKFLLNIK